MKVSDIKIKLSEYLKGDKKTKIIVILGILGVMMIFLSEVIPDKSNDEKTATTQKQQLSDDEAEIYKQKIQSELKQILSKIDGVGDCDVMLTVEGTTEIVYAQNIEKSSDSNTTGYNDKYQNEIVLIEQSGEKQALVRKIIKPKINGVVIVCEGGGNTSVSERVINAVSTALDLSSGKICVEGKNK